VAAKRHVSFELRRSRHRGGRGRTRLLMVVAPIVLTSCATSSMTKIITSKEGILAARKDNGLSIAVKGRVAVVSWATAWPRILRYLVVGATMTELPAQLAGMSHTEKGLGLYPADFHLRPSTSLPLFFAASDSPCQSKTIPRHLIGYC
jgi:hypothetical protein